MCLLSMKLKINFEGRRVWAYQRYNLMSGYPKKILDPYFPKHFKAVINLNGKLHFIRVIFTEKFILLIA